MIQKILFQVRLKAQEKKVDHMERAKRLEEIPLLKAQHDVLKVRFQFNTKINRRNGSETIKNGKAKWQKKSNLSQEDFKTAFAEIRKLTFSR